MKYVDQKALLLVAQGKHNKFTCYSISIHFLGYFNLKYYEITTFNTFTWKLK